MNIEAAQRIYRAIQELTTESGESLAIGAIRDTVGSWVSRDEFSATLVEMFNLGIIVIAPEDNQKTITSADEYNAVTVAGERRHLVILP